MVHSDLPAKGGASAGGVPHQVSQLSAALVDRGHDVVVHVLQVPAHQLPYRVEPLPASVWTRDSRVRRVLAAPFAFGLGRYGEVDVIHAHGDSQLLLRRGTKIVRTFYGSARDEARVAASAKHRAIETYNHAGERLARRLADRTTGISHATERAIGPLDAIIPCGIDRDRFHPGPKAERPMILFVGTMAGRKRGRLVLEAFRRDVLPRVPHAELVLVAADAATDSGPNVRVVRSPSDDDVAALMREAWVFTMPSSYEGFGVPYVEAMASGTAVLTTPNAGALELYSASGRGGELVAEDAFGIAIAALLGDTSRRDALATEGRDASAAYAWQTIAKAHELVYQL